jgi:hypothetical protein
VRTSRQDSFYNDLCTFVAELDSESGCSSSGALEVRFNYEVSVMSGLTGVMAERNAGGKGASTRKRKKEQFASTQQSVARMATQSKVPYRSFRGYTSCCSLAI